MSETPLPTEATDLGAIPGTEDIIQAKPTAFPVTEISSEDSGLQTVPVAEVKPEDVGTFSLRYHGRTPQLVVTGGTVVPSVLTVVDGAGNTLAEYTARPATPAQGPTAPSSRAFPMDQNQLIGCSTPDCTPITLG